MLQTLQSLHGSVQYDAEGRAVLLAEVPPGNLSQKAEEIVEGVKPMKLEGKKPPELRPGSGGPLKPRHWLLIVAGFLSVGVGFVIISVICWRAVGCHKPFIRRLISDAIPASRSMGCPGRPAPLGIPAAPKPPVSQVTSQRDRPS